MCLLLSLKPSLSLVPVDALVLLPRPVMHLHLWLHMLGNRLGAGCPGFGLIWLWMWDHTGQGALKQNKWIQTRGQPDEWERELSPCLTDPPHPFFIENRIPHHQHHDCNSNSQASGWGLRVTLSVPHPGKESQFLFCIHVVGEPTMTAVPLQIWQ